MRTVGRDLTTAGRLSERPQAFPRVDASDTPAARQLLIKFLRFGDNRRVAQRLDRVFPCPF